MKAWAIPQAIFIWTKHLCLHEAKFEHVSSLSEKEISMKTWDGCTASEYDTNPGFYKRLNTAVIDCLRTDNTYKGTKYRKIERMYGVAVEGQPAETKICRTNKRQALDKQKRVISIAGGCMASALSLNERHELGTAVGQQLFLEVQKKVGEMNLVGLTDDRKEEMAKQLFIEQAIEAGKAYGQADIVQGVLGVLDNSPPLIAMDSKVGDEYAQEADKRRAKNDMDIRKLDVPTIRRLCLFHHTRTTIPLQRFRTCPVTARNHHHPAISHEK